MKSATNREMVVQTPVARELLRRVAQGNHDMEQSDQTPPGWHDIPTADPRIQKDYEAALGAFLVAFTRIENTASDIIFLALEQAGRKDILNRLRGDSFRRKLVALELISLAHPRPLPKSAIDELRDLAARRNELAHGHFHQNPFDGSYEILTDRKALPMPVTQLKQLTERAESAWDTLRYAEAYFSFDDLDEEESS